MSERCKEIYDYLVDFGIATEKEIRLVTSINGTTEDSLNAILFCRTGYRSVEQLQECEPFLECV